MAKTAINSSHPLAANMIFLIGFDEASGDVLDLVSGGAVSGTIRAGSTRGSDPTYGSTLDSDAGTISGGIVQTGVNFGDNDLLGDRTAATIFIWQKSDIAAMSGDYDFNHEIIGKYGGGDDSFRFNWQKSENVNTIFQTTGGSGSVTIVDGLSGANQDPTVWHGVAASYDGTTITLRIGTAFTNTAGVTGAILNTDHDFLVHEVWHGQAAVIAIFDKALSAAEYNDLYADPLGLFASSSPDVTVSADAIDATVAVSGMGVLSVVRSASPIVGAGALAGTAHVSVSGTASPIAAIGELSGLPIRSVSQLAQAISATGSLSGVASASQVVLITANPIDASGTVDGASVLSVDQPATPISGTGTLSAQAVISISRLSNAITAGGSLLGTVSIGGGVIVSADPISALGLLYGLPVIAVDISAELISATGDLLGTVQITSPGNVVISANPIQSAGGLQGNPVIDVNVGDVIGANGLTLGNGFTSLVIEAAPITGTGGMAGGYRIDVDIPAAIIEAQGSLSGDLVRNVLQAAAAIVGNGQLVGTAQIVGPGQLGDISDPGIISKTPRYAVISITPRRGTLN